MKEATGEVSMTVITIVILALLVGLGSWVFSTKGPARNWIDKFFNSDAAKIETNKNAWEQEQ